LIGGGHYFPAADEAEEIAIGILGYSQKQIEGFLDSIERKKIAARADRIEEIAYAARTIFADGKTIKTLVDGVRKHGKRK
jgi:hypothetical protein